MSASLSCGEQATHVITGDYDDVDLKTQVIRQGHDEARTGNDGRCPLDGCGALRWRGRRRLSDQRGTRGGPASVQRLRRRVGLCVSGLHGPTWPSRVTAQARRWIDRKPILGRSSMTACRYSDREHLILTYHTDRAAPCHDRAVGPCALRGSGHCDRCRVPRVWRHARAAGACSGDAGRADCALSWRRRALALRAHPLAEILPMRRSHRSAHRALWPILALVVALGLAAALALRPPPNVEAPQATEGIKS